MATPIIDRNYSMPRATPLAVHIPIAISNRHVHLTASVIEQLFADHYRLHCDHRVNPGQQFVATECVTLVGPIGRIRNVRVVGPPRKINQVEISRSDAEILGLNVPVRESGDIIGSPGILIEGPRSLIRLGTGVICAQRHIHMTPVDARRLGLKDRDRVSVSTQGPNRALQFRDVLVRISPDYNLELHVDSDEANAAGVKLGDHAVLDSLSWTCA